MLCQGGSCLECLCMYIHVCVISLKMHGQGHPLAYLPIRLLKRKRQKLQQPLSSTTLSLIQNLAKGYHNHYMCVFAVYTACPQEVHQHLLDHVHT